jgi:stress-induced morphogen
VITQDAIIGYIRDRLPDAAVTVVDRTGAMDHFLVRVVSAGFAGKNLLDRNRIVYQALDGPLADGRIHALEIKALAPGEP